MCVLGQEVMQWIGHHDAQRCRYIHAIRLGGMVDVHVMQCRSFRARAWTRVQDKG